MVEQVATQGPLARSGWRGRYLKASVGVEPNQPPSTGWKFWRVGGWGEAGGWEVDATISCNIYVNSPPCCLTVTLSGAAKEVQGKCEGEYKSTGLISMGRPVNIF